MSLYHDVIEALTPLLEAFDQLGIIYYIGGSVSSSLHGMARQTQDVDVIAGIGHTQVHPLVQALQGDYYLDEQAWQAAIRHGQPYNVIHLHTMLKGIRSHRRELKKLGKKEGKGKDIDPLW